MQIRFATDKGTTGWQPFTFSRRSRVILHGVANGEPVEILLDSGAETTVVDRRLAEKLHLARTGTATLNDRQSATSADLASGLEVGIGTLRVNGLRPLVADLGAVRHQTGLDVDVILGREVFERTVVDIDFRQQRISFSNPEGFAPPAGAAHTALSRFPAGHGRVVVVRIEGGTNVSLEFDLGSATPIVLEHPFWTSAHLADGRVLSNTLIGTLGGISETAVISLRTIEIAGINLRNVETVLAPARGALEVRLGSGTAGMPIFSRFRIITDYSRSRLYVVGNPSDGLEVPRNRSGLRVLHEGRSLRVLLVARHSPAEETGWSEGERISAVDGVAVDEGYWSSDLSRWAERPAGTRVSLTLDDGTRRELVLRDYF